MQKASSLTEFSQKRAIQALTVNQSIQKKVRYSGKQHDSLQLTEATQTPDNSNAFLKSGGCRIHDQPLPSFHRRHEPVSGQGMCHAQRSPGNTIPCLAKQERKSVLILRTRLLESKCQSVEACSQSEPSKEPLKADQLFSPLNAPFAQRSQDAQPRKLPEVWGARAGKQFVTLSTELV